MQSLGAAKLYVEDLAARRVVGFVGCLRVGEMMMMKVDGGEEVLWRMGVAAT